MTAAQRIARERYPNASRWPHDFTAAQGYAACYEELVVPLLQRVSDRSGTPQATEGSAEYSEERDPRNEGDAQNTPEHP